MVTQEEGGVGGVGGVQWRERLAGGRLEVWSDRPSLVSSDMKNLWRRSPALASLVWRGLYCRQLENIRSTSETNSPEEEEQERKEEEREEETEEEEEEQEREEEEKLESFILLL